MNANICSGDFECHLQILKGSIRCRYDCRVKCWSLYLFFLQKTREVSYCLLHYQLTSLTLSGAALRTVPTPSSSKASLLMFLLHCSLSINPTTEIFFSPYLVLQQSLRCSSNLYSKSCYKTGLNLLTVARWAAKQPWWGWKSKDQKANVMWHQWNGLLVHTGDAAGENKHW